MPRTPERLDTAILVRVSEADREAMKRAAAAAGTTLSTLIRAAVNDLVERILHERVT